VIVHTGTGWRDIWLPRAARRATSALKASIERPGVRSTRLVGPCVVKGTSAVNVLDNIARTISRRSLRRSRESRGAAGAGKYTENTIVLLQLMLRFRKSGNDLR